MGKKIAGKLQLYYILVVTVTVRWVSGPLAFALCAITFVRPASAAELYSWHSQDFSIRAHSKLEVVLHSRLRTRREFGSLQQVRTGPIVRWQAGPKLAPFFGYYYQPGHDPGTTWSGGHRIFAGVETAAALPRGCVLTTRLAIERHMIRTRGFDYNRYRTYSRLLFPGRVSPYLQTEWLAVRQGFHSTRNSGGIRLRLGAGTTLEAGYVYDIRRTFWGGDRQAVVTSLRFQIPAKRR